MTTMPNHETLTSPPVIPSVCGKCGVEERHLLLHVRCRGITRRFCSSCILRSYPQYFCPTCFAFYGPTPPSGPEFLTCTKCYSLTHSPCSVTTNAALGPFLCPLCVKPHSPLFSPRRTIDGKREIDSKSAMILFTAAKIAASTMEKAAESAKAEAEKRAKEAAVTRKRAKEALEHIAVLEAKERLKRKEIGNGNGNNSSSVIDRNQKPCNVVNNSSQIVVTKNAGMGSELSGASNQIGGGDGTNEVSARLNAVGLKEKDRLPGQVTPSPGVKTIGTVGDESERMRMNVGGSINKAIGGKVTNGLYPVPSVGSLNVRNLSNNPIAAKANTGLYAVPPSAGPQNAAGLTNNSVGANSNTGLYSVPPGSQNAAGLSNNTIGANSNSGLYSVPPSAGSQNAAGLTNNSIGPNANTGLYSVPNAGIQNVGGSSNNSTVANANNGLYSVPATVSQNVGGSINSSMEAKANNGLYSLPPAVDRPPHVQNINAQEENPFRKQ